MKKLIEEKIFDGVTFSYVQDDRFKNDAVTAVFYLPLSKETVSTYAVLTRLLVRTCSKYPDYTELSKKLSSLYGASLYADCAKVGDRLALTFSVVGLDDRYALFGEKISAELSELLCEILFNPKLDGEKFDFAELELAKRELEDVIDSEFNEKRVYALNRAVSLMYGDEPFSVSRLGSKDALRLVTPASLYDAWLVMLQTAEIRVNYVGESSSQFAKKTFEKNFSLIQRTPAELKNTVLSPADAPKEFCDEMELSQSKMILGFSTGCAEPDENVMATRLMCAVLGGTAHSKLFNNVREKLSLCYYCSSSYDRQKGMMLISSGVERENLLKAKTAILHEISAMQDGDITDFEIESAKMSVKNSFKERDNSVSGISGWYLSQTFDGRVYTDDEAAAALDAVTKDEVVNAAKRLKLHTVYTLRGISKDGGEA